MRIRPRVGGAVDAGGHQAIVVKPRVIHEVAFNVCILHGGAKLPKQHGCIPHWCAVVPALVVDWHARERGAIGILLPQRVL